MNVSINEIAYDIIELYRANYKDTDSLSKYQVYHWINVARAFLIQQRLSKNFYSIYPEEIQVITNFEVSQISTGLVGTDAVVPATLSRAGYQGTLTRVTLPYIISGVGATEAPFSDGPVQIVNKARFDRSGNRKFNSNFYFATINTDKKLYLKTYDFATGVTDYGIQIEGVFQNPIEVMVLNGVTLPYDADYPINMHLLPDLKKLIVNDHFKSILQQLEDKNNDGRDSMDIKTEQ